MARELAELDKLKGHLKCRYERVRMRCRPMRSGIDVGDPGDRIYGLNLRTELTGRSTAAGITSNSAA